MNTQMNTQSCKITMDQFFSRAGELKNSHTRAVGTFPTRKFIAVFEHENGKAEFDGKDWKFFLINFNGNENAIEFNAY